MPTPTVNLAAINPLLEILVRAGDPSVQDGRAILQRAYIAQDADYPDTMGISTLFRQGATFDDLAQAGRFPHKKLSYSVLGKLMEELASAGYQLVLYVTPTSRLPDHHSLAVSLNGVVQTNLADDAADALIRALQVVDNPYRHPKR